MMCGYKYNSQRH